MSKWILITLLAIGFTMASTGFNPVQAQIGYSYGPAPHCHGHHGHGHSSGYRTGYAPYGYGVPPVYGSSLGGYYSAPGLSFSRSTFYSGGIVPSPYGLGVGGLGVGGYSNYYGYRPQTLPRVQLRVGF